MHTVVGCIGETGKITDARPDEMGLSSSEYVEEIELARVESVILLPITLEGSLYHEKRPDDEQPLNALDVAHGNGN